MRRAFGPIVIVAAAIAALAAAPAAADMALQKKAKDLKLAAVQNCQSCHVDKMPKKGASAVNDMGKWLVEQKAAKKAKEIDVAWLKDYKPKAK
jgi:mono/diheme cytochrome c family protein